MTTLDIVGLCGSLRAGSVNRMALKLAGSVMPEGMALDIVDLRDIPMFDGDVLAKGFPAPVQALRERLKKADGIVIATPEYNFSVPGMLKNAIDWASRGDDQPFSYMPLALLSASPGPLGGPRVQYEVRRIMQFLNGMVLPKPEVFIGSTGAKFDADGKCTDDTTVKFVTAQMQAFEAWVAAVKRMKAG